MIYQKLPVIFLSTVANEKHDTINAEIASYIIAHLEELQDIGIKDLAARCHVAVSQISRFVRSIGLCGFSELRDLINTSSLSFENSSASHFMEERSADYIAEIKDSIDLISQSADLEKIHVLCLDIQKYEKVAVFGLLKAESAALSLQCDLFMQHKIIYTNSSYSEQIDYITHASSDTLIIVLSYTGSYFDYVNIRGKEGHLSLPKIYMISGKQDRIPSFVHHLITFDSHSNQISHPYQLQIVAGLIAQEYANIIR